MRTLFGPGHDARYGRSLPRRLEALGLADLAIRAEPVPLHALWPTRDEQAGGACAPGPPGACADPVYEVIPVN